MIRAPPLLPLRSCIVIMSLLSPQRHQSHDHDRWPPACRRRRPQRSRSWTRDGF